MGDWHLIRLVARLVVSPSAIAADGASGLVVQIISVRILGISVADQKSLQLGDIALVSSSWLVAASVIAAWVVAACIIVLGARCLGRHWPSGASERILTKTLSDGDIGPERRICIVILKFFKTISTFYVLYDLLNGSTADGGAIGLLHMVG